MAKRQETRVRYDQELDTFIYELYDEQYGEWGLIKAAKCVRREGAEEGEEANYIAFDFMKQIVHDCWLCNCDVHLA